MKWTFLSILIFFAVLAILPLLFKKNLRKPRVLLEPPGKNVLVKKVPFPSNGYTVSSKERKKEFRKHEYPAKKSSNKPQTTPKKQALPPDRSGQLKTQSKSSLIKRTEQEFKRGAQKIFVVQVGAFKKEKNALALMERLNKKGYKVFLSPQKHPALGVVYHVCLDPVKSQVEAQKLIKKLSESEGMKNIFVKTIHRGEKLQ